MYITIIDRISFRLTTTMSAEHQPSFAPALENEDSHGASEYSGPSRENDNIPRVLQIEQIDEMRSRQYAALRQHARELGLDHRMSDNERSEIAGGVVDSVMEESGLDTEDSQFGMAYRFLRGVSVDRIQGDWSVPPQDPATGEYLPSERQNAEEYIARHFSQEPEPEADPVAPVGETPEEPVANPEDETSTSETDTEDETDEVDEPVPQDEPRLDPLDEATAARLTPEQTAEVDRLHEAWQAAHLRLNESRDEYLRRRAGNARRSLHFGEYRNSAVKDAREQYEIDLAETYRIMKEALAITGEGEAVYNAQAITQERTLAERYREHRLVATGNYTFDEQGKLTDVKRGFIGRQMNKFYNWYGSVNAGGKWYSKGGLKKAGILGGVTAVAGGAAGLAAGAILAPVGGFVVAGVGAGVLVNRITKAYMATHINKKSHDINDQHAQLQYNELMSDYENDTETDRSMADLIDDQAKREVGRNRKRAALTVGAMALSAAAGGVLGGLVHDHVLDRDTAHAAAPATETQPDDGGKLPVVTPGEIAGFQTAVNVEAGHGYAHEISDLFAQKGIHLSPAQSYEAYQHLEQKFPGGNFFTDNTSYAMGGDYGIGRSGSSHWNDAVVRELDAWSKARHLG